MPQASFPSFHVSNEHATTSSPSLKPLSVRLLRRSQRLFSLLCFFSLFLDLKNQCCSRLLPRSLSLELWRRKSVSVEKFVESSVYLSWIYRFSVRAAKGTNTKSLTGVVFEPFEEVKKELDLVPNTPLVSLARHKFSDDSESAINDQINVEYNVSYIYHALYAYFDRDNVGLKGFAMFFNDSSLEERGHAEKFMEYQNKRGGRVKLQSMLMPISEFDHEEKGDALYAMELALSLEKLTNEKLLKLQSVGVKNNDVQLVDFVESEFLGEQVEAIKKISEYVAQLRRVGKGHGVWHFDQMLLNEG